MVNILRHGALAHVDLTIFHKHLIQTRTRDYANRAAENRITITTFGRSAASSATSDIRRSFRYPIVCVLVHLSWPEIRQCQYGPLKVLMYRQMPYLMPCRKKLYAESMSHFQSL